VRVLHDELPPLLRSLVGPGELESIRARLATAKLPDKPELHARDLVGAVGIFFIVVLSTFPVALPFVLMSDLKSALLVSRLLTFAMLFGGGWALAQHAGYPGWKGGLMLLGLGVSLTVAIIALGG
jgi:VIT1/CCC1 family predicted Fe2+/Mn2+ transporter